MGRMYRDEGGHAPHLRRPAGTVRRRRPIRRWDEEELHGAVLEYLRKELEPARRERRNAYVCREELEDNFRASTGVVTKMLLRLNREGYVTSKCRSFAHDSSRDPFFGIKGWSGWAANIYRILEEGFDG